MRKLFLLATLSFSILNGVASQSSFAQTSQQSRSLVATWLGVLTVNNNKLRLVLRIAVQGGALKASMDSVDQPNGNNLHVDTINFSDNVLHFELKTFGIAYDGVLSKDEAQIVGTFKQGAGSFPLTFVKQSVQRTVQRGKVTLKTCDNPALPEGTLCGSYEVFENRAARSGRKIPLNIVLLPAIAAKPAADPLFYLAGGPGGAATAYAGEKFMAGLRRNREVVLVDQRGTGQSNPLNCPSPGSRQDMRGYFGEVMSPERVRACRTELEKIADLTQYTSSIAMDDVDEVRSALGYDRIDLYGGSYGTTTALVYLRQHPEHTRVVAIFGVAPPSAKLPLFFARSVQAAVDRLFVDCAADDKCRTAFPNLKEEFQKVMAQFASGSVETSAPNVYTSETQKVTVTKDAFVDAVRQLLYVPEAAAAIPLLIHLAANGNLGPFIGTAFQVVSQIDAKIARGMQFSVICAENTPFITEADLKQANANSFYGDARTRPTIRACAEWPAAKVPGTFIEPVKSDVPVLLISGEIDPVTPPWLAESAAKTLSRSKVVRIKNGTHASYECIENLVADFIDKGSTEGLDYSCVEKIARPTWTIPSQ